MGIAIGIVAFLYAIGSDYLQNAEGEIALAISPKRPSVHFPLSGETKLLLGDRAHSGPVHSIQFAVWNRGRKSIWGEEISGDYIDLSVGEHRVLSAVLLNVTNPNAKLELNLDDTASGRVRVKWHVLQPDEGGMVQIVYLGPRAALAKASANIVDHDPVEVALAGSPASIEDYWPDGRSNRPTLGIVLLVAGLMGCGLAWLGFRLYQRFSRTGTAETSGLISDSAAVVRWFVVVASVVTAGALLVALVDSWSGISGFPGGPG